MNENGKVLENSRIKNNLKYVGRFFDENINDEKVRVVMESSSVWYNIYSYLSEEKHLNVVTQFYTRLAKIKGSSKASSNITQFYTRLAKIKGSSKAAVSAASKLLKIVFWVMKEKRKYHYSKRFSE